MSESIKGKLRQVKLITSGKKPFVALEIEGDKRSFTSFEVRLADLPIGAEMEFFAKETKRGDKTYWNMEMPRVESTPVKPESPKTNTSEIMDQAFGFKTANKMRYEEDTIQNRIIKGMCFNNATVLLATEWNKGIGTKKIFDLAEDLYNEGFGRGYF